MIIVGVKSGQLGNQLLTQASALALALEAEQNLLFLSSSKEFKDYFNLSFDNESAISIRYCKSRVSNMLSKALLLLSKLLKDTKRIKFFRNTLILYWAYKEDDIFLKHIEEIREYYKFREHITNKCTKEILEIRSNDKKIVAVHIRRGDYINFNGGKWYYSDREYLKYITELYNERRDLKFLIFSNEDLEEEIYINSNIPIYFSKGSAVEDLCKMSLCDYIMGPPSTFSWWASVIGDVKRYPITDSKEICSIDKFLNIEERIITNTNLY